MIEVLVVIGASPAAVSAQEEPISWYRSYAEGLAEAKKLEKPVMLDFTAEWCQWCKVMDKEVFPDVRVTKIAREFVCIKVDIDHEKQAVFDYKVSTVPRVIFLNKYGEVIGDHMGYVDADRFYELLKDVRLNAYKKLEGVIASVKSEAEIKLGKIREQLKENKEAVDLDELVNFFSDPEPFVRKQAAGILVEMKDRSAPTLVSALSARYLGIRIAAWEALRALKVNDLDFDPWASAQQREESVLKWKTWLSGILKKEFSEGDLKKGMDAVLQIYAGAKPAQPSDQHDRNLDWKPDLWTYKVNDQTILTEYDDDYDGKPDRAAASYTLSARRALVVSLRLTGGKPEAVDSRVEPIPSFQEPDLGRRESF